MSTKDGENSQIQGATLTVHQNEEINQILDDEQEYWDETDCVRALNYFSDKLISIIIFYRISSKKKRHSDFCSSFTQTLMQCLNLKSN